MTHWTKVRTLLAKSVVIEWTILLPPIADRCLMTVNTFLAFLTVAFLHEVAAYRYFFFLINVQIFAVVSAFTLSLEPMNAYNLLLF